MRVLASLGTRDATARKLNATKHAGAAFCCKHKVRLVERSTSYLGQAIHVWSPCAFGSAAEQDPDRTPPNLAYAIVCLQHVITTRRHLGEGGNGGAIHSSSAINNATAKTGKPQPFLDRTPRGLVCSFCIQCISGFSGLLHNRDRISARRYRGHHKSTLALQC